MSRAARVLQRYFGGLLVFTQLTNPADILIQMPELERVTHVICIRGRAPPAPVPDSLSENCCCVAFAACTPMEWLRFAVRVLPLHRSCHGGRLCCRHIALLGQVAGWDGLRLIVTHLAARCCWGLCTHPGALLAS